MNDDKHTPGPWHISRQSQFVRKGYPTIGDGPKDFNVCEVLDVTNPEEFQANARIIAAAPELLDAL